MASFISSARWARTLDFILARMPHDAVIRIERKTRLALAGVLVLYCLSVIAIIHWGMPFVDAYYMSRPVDNVARSLVLSALLWVLSPFLPLGAYLCPYGLATARTGRYPPPGWKVFGSERIIVGRRAKVVGVIVCAFGAVTLAGFAAVVGYFCYVILIR